MTSRLFAFPTRWLALLPCALLLMPLGLPALAADLPEVVATVQDQPISAQELSASMRGQLLQMDMERYEAMKAQLDSLIAERLMALEAAERGMSMEELERVEVFAKTEPVTPEQVRTFYDNNKERLQRSFEELEGRIMAHLQRQSEARRRAALHAAEEAPVGFVQALQSAALDGDRVRRHLRQAECDLLRGHAPAFQGCLHQTRVAVGVQLTHGAAGVDGERIGSNPGAQFAPV